MITPYSTNLKEFVIVLLVQSLPQFFKCFKFGSEEIYPSETREVIYTYMYIPFLAMLSICIGPIRSMWTNSSTLVVEPS